MKLYAIPGLGADSRVFQLLKLDVPVINLEWIAPLKNESLAHYANRLSEQIKKDEPFGIIGVSFGGMVAVEIAKKLNPEITVIISSVVITADLPRITAFARKIPIHKVVPSNLLKSFPGILSWFFSTRNKKMLLDIIADTDPVFLNWALGSIINWQNEEEPVNYLRLHGSADRLIPLKGKVNYAIVEGGHFMIVDKAKYLSWVINKELSELLQLY